MRNNLNQSPYVPPFIAFGTFEKANEKNTVSCSESYDYTTQKTIIPMFCGSEKKVTKSARNVGSFWDPKWKNETDDAKEK